MRSSGREEGKKEYHEQMLKSRKICRRVSEAINWHLEGSFKELRREQ